MEPKIDHKDDQRKNMWGAVDTSGMALSGRDELGGMGKKSYLAQRLRERL